MKKLFILLLSIITLGMAEKIIVVGSKDFKDTTFSRDQIKAIFLAKKTFYNGKRILVMNYESNNNLRECFEKKILKKTEVSLERYWRRAYYKGLRPPKVISSKEMLNRYMEEILPSIGYISDRDKISENMTPLIVDECR